jgi:hypothetical protein
MGTGAQRTGRRMRKLCEARWYPGAVPYLTSRHA